MSCTLCGSDHHNRSACPWKPVYALSLLLVWPFIVALGIARVTRDVSRVFVQKIMGVWRNVS